MFAARRSVAMVAQRLCPSAAAATTMMMMPSLVSSSSSSSCWATGARRAYSLEQISGLAAPAITIALFASPLKIAQEIHAKKSVLQYSPVPYMTMACNCILWVNYGVLYNMNMSIIVPNFVGLTLAVATLAIYSSNCTQPAQKATVLKHSAALTAITAGTLAYFNTYVHPAVAVEQLGLLASGMCVAMFASPLATVGTVLKQKDASSLPAPFIAMSVLNCSCWLTYGLCLGNPYIIIPNSMGLALSCIQLALCIMYRKRV